MNTPSPQTEIKWAAQTIPAPRRRKMSARAAMLYAQVQEIAAEENYERRLRNAQHALRYRNEARMRDAARSWEDATEVEKLQAQVDDLRQGLDHLHSLVVEAFTYTTTFEGAADFLKDEWGK